MEAVDTIVSVLNAIRGKMVKEEKKGITWSAEAQVPVQGALPRVHPGSVLHAVEEEIAAEKRRFERMEIVREESMIGLLNAIALSEMFDNTDVAKAIREGILRMESPHAKKVMNGIALGGKVNPLEATPAVRAEEPAVARKPREKRSIEEIFGVKKSETDFSDVG